MARYKDAVCRLCRRENTKLFLKGERCYTDKCAMIKRPYAPGQHGLRRTKVSEYGVQLREKQKTRRFYGVLERQFRNYFDTASRRKGITGENLLQLLELRLDNVIYRLGLATSRAEARQLVNHAHFTVNGIKVNIPSYQVKAGEIILIAEKSKNLQKFKDVLEVTGSKVVPQWLDFDIDAMTGKVITLPLREDVDLQVEEHLIVELYSK